ncbi:MAG TPA: NAD(P)/FAD-dependent oxidoreductase [Bacteroidetes bacterium]|nr:NAD(P)/FAD-dependent oxidoreductase [Bacteroidota bacterium]
METDVLVIGAGPAGLTAALQLKRSGLDPFLVEKSSIGGSLLNARCIENYPGVPSGISGRELARLLDEHIRDFGVEVHAICVERLDRRGDGFMAACSQGDIFARAVIVASGGVPLHLGLPGEDAYSGKLVFHELKDLPEDAGRSACVIGGGDVAFDYALSLAESGIGVKLIMRSDRPRALKKLEAEAQRTPGIAIISQAEPIQFLKDSGSVCIHFRDSSQSPLRCDFVLVAIGRRPNVDFLAPELMKRSYPDLPLFFAGDVVNGSFRQVGIAVGDGLRCAMQVVQLLLELE